MLVNSSYYGPHSYYFIYLIPITLTLRNAHPVPRLHHHPIAGIKGPTSLIRALNRLGMRLHDRKIRHPPHRHYQIQAASQPHPNADHLRGQVGHCPLNGSISNYSVKKTYASEGVAGFFRGASISVLGSVIAFSCYMNIYEASKKRLSRTEVRLA